MAPPPCLGRRELTVQASRPDRRRRQDRESSHYIFEPGGYGPVGAPRAQGT